MPQGKGTYGNKVGRPANKNKDKKNFKPHMMYCKDGSSKKAKTYQEHLALKKKGCGHSKKEVMKMDAKVEPSPVDPKTGKKTAKKRGNESPRKEES